MPDADPAPVAAVQPDPSQSVPEHVGRVLGLLATLVTYGKKLAATLRQHADNPHGFPGFASVAVIFRTGDVTQILDRIARGLLRAAALEARLNRFAARGRDLTPSPVRMSTSRNAPADQSVAAMDNPPRDPAPEADLVPLPTLDDIIARDRRRPVGAVLVDICHDFGIMPGDLDRATSDELYHYLIGYGGSLVKLLFRRPGPGAWDTPGVFHGYFTGPIPIQAALAPLVWPAPPLPAPVGTGPP